MLRRFLPPLILLLLIITLALVFYYSLKSFPYGQTPVSAPSISPTPASKTLDPNFFPVTKIIDGDTITVDVDGQPQTVRLIGVDTPEIVDPRRSIECFGQQASDQVSQLLAGKSVHLEFDPTQGDQDKYGRLLRYVYLEDGTSLNKYLIEQGYAHEYTYELPYKYRDEYLSAQKSAQDNNRGLWDPNVCPTPTR